MQRGVFNDLTEATFDRIRELNATKGVEYSGHEDVLSDFKEVAAQLGIDPKVALLTYATKHWRAINSYVRRGHVLSEAILGRIDDLILYSILLQAMIEEEHPTVSAPAQPWLPTDEVAAERRSERKAGAGTDEPRGHNSFWWADQRAREAAASEED